MSKRVTYQNWIVKLGRDPADQSANETPIPAERLFASLDRLADALALDSEAGTSDTRQERIVEAVQHGLNELDEDEREFLILFHFMGKSYRQIAEQSGRELYRLEALHLRALKRLRSLLARFVATEFGIITERGNDCPICNSPHVSEIDQIIDQKQEEETWRRSMREIAQRFGLKLTTPQILIGHRRFHRSSNNQ